MNEEKNTTIEYLGMIIEQNWMILRMNHDITEMIVTPRTGPSSIDMEKMMSPE